MQGTMMDIITYFLGPLLTIDVKYISSFLIILSNLFSNIAKV